MARSPDVGLLQGTLDMFVLKAVSLIAVAIAARLPLQR
jgi:hypothetical protein